MEGMFTDYFCNITGIVFQYLPSAINKYLASTVVS